jgi:hypothetical protein
MRTEYGRWSIHSSGAWWPMQRARAAERRAAARRDAHHRRLDTAGVPAESLTVSEFGAGPVRGQLEAQRFRRSAFGARGQPTELRPGIVASRISGRWTLVKQPDGVVIFEAHISAQYCATS